MLLQKQYNEIKQVKVHKRHIKIINSKNNKRNLVIHTQIL